MQTVAAALATVAVADASYIAFDAPPSRYGNYVPDHALPITNDPFLTTKCGLRSEGPFPSAATKWTSGSQPCVSVKEVGVHTVGAVYELSVLDATGVAVYQQVVGAEPLGNDLAALHQAVDAGTGLPVFEWCVEEGYGGGDGVKHHYETHERFCQPRNDLVVAHRHMTLSLPSDLECADCTLQLAARSAGVTTYACANIDVLNATAGEASGVAAVAHDASTCVSQPANLGLYKADMASRFALKGWWSLWKWTIVSWVVARLLIFIWAGVLGHRALKAGSVGSSEDDLPEYTGAPGGGKSGEAAVSDPENPDAALITNGPEDDAATPSSSAPARSGCSHRRRQGCRGGGRCQKSRVRIGLEMRGPRRAGWCVRCICGLLSVAYVLVGIVAALAYVSYAP